MANKYDKILGEYREADTTDHTELENIGTNTHDQIDTALTASASHISNTSNPHSVTKAQVGLSTVDNTSDANKPVSTATQAQLNTKTSQSYILSRGTDLVTNGTGYMGNNTNFAPATYISDDAPLGAVGSFQAPIYAGGSPSIQVNTVELIPVDPNKRYLLSASIRQATPGLTAYQYLALSPSDAFGLSITTQMYMCRPGTLTTLAAPLNPGDTTMTLTSSANWKLTAGAATHWRNIIFWDYTDPGGKLWPPETYSRNIINNAYPDGGISGNVMTLNTPYVGPAKPSGTMLSNGGAGGTYMYQGMVNAIATSEWVRYSSSAYSPVGGVHTQPTTPGADPTSAVTALPPGTANMRIVILLNRSFTGLPVVGSKVRFAGVSFSDASAAYASAQTKAPLVHAHNDLYYTKAQIDAMFAAL